MSLSTFKQTPNHALQRTAPRVTARAFCERSTLYIWASSVRSTVGHAPRHAPPSLSLGSLGHSTRMTSSRETRAAEIQESIRRVLRHDWNPIGFGDVLPEDEYDSYVAPVYRILAGSRLEQELVEYLFRTGEGIVGATPTPSPDYEHLRPVARRLLELDVRL